MTVKVKVKMEMESKMISFGPSLKLSQLLKLLMSAHLWQSMTKTMASQVTCKKRRRCLTRKRTKMQRPASKT